MDCSPPGFSVPGDSPGKNTGVGCHALLQGIFPIQGLNQVFPIAGRFFTDWATKEAHNVDQKASTSRVQEWRSWIWRERVCNGLSDPTELLVLLILVPPGAMESFCFLLDSAEQGWLGGVGSKKNDATYFRIWTNKCPCMSFIAPCANCQKDSEVRQTLPLASGRLWPSGKGSPTQSVQKWGGKRVRMGWNTCSAACLLS